MRWPQITMIVWFVLIFCSNLIFLMRDGMSRAEKEGKVGTILSVITSATILYCGGFWG
jgi:hypothetical protein